MSTPQNPYDPNRGSDNENTGENSAPDQSRSANDNGEYGSSNQAPQYGSNEPTRSYDSGDQAPSYGSDQPTRSYGSDNQAPSYGSGDQAPSYGSDNQAPSYGSQPQYGQDGQYGGSQGGYDQNQGYGQGYDQNAQGYGQNYDQNAQGYGQSYDANQYGQQPAYAATGGGGDQFTPANPNASYGSYSSGSGGSTSKNIWGILALIGGIVGVVLSFVFGIGLIFGIAAVIFGFIGLSAIKKGLASNKGVTITGLILGFVSILISIIVIIATIIGIGMLGKAVDEQMSEAPTSYGAPIDPTDPGAESPATEETAEAAPVEGGEVEIGTDVTAAVSVATGTASDTAIGAESTNGEIAIVTMTIKNNSSSELDMSLTSVTASNGSGATYSDVFDGNKYQGILAFSEPVPAGGEKTYEFAYGVPADEVDQMELQLLLFEDLGKGTTFDFKKV
ncbi:DUF4190 domain-containing protein [Brevibacterium casei]|uniref:DUF4190 domain-containing protein n=1 Tax=Brevibacterium casei TaxID=33889 RepID=UPI003F804844